MIRLAALLWLAIVIVAGGHLAYRIYDGLAFRTDLLALLPQEEQDPVLQRANDQVTDAISRRVVILVGHPQREDARAAAQRIGQTLSDSRLVTVETTSFDDDRLRRIGELYYPYRSGLLAEGDRALLLEGRGQEIATRALSQVFGVVGMADAKLLQKDPFLLLPSFFASLPLPMSRLSLDEGLLTVRDNGITWILVAGHLNEQPYALDTQERLAALLEPVMAAQRDAHADLQILRLGAVFFAAAGAEQAMRESSLIGAASLIGTVLLILVVFRSPRPLWLSIVAIGVGIGCALSASLWLFGELHVAALLFGVSLIGIAVDYSLQYFSELFAPEPGSPDSRLARVLPGMTLGMVTVLIGYLTLFLAPFPGLHQIAAFSAVGLLASWITVVLWLPVLDRTKAPRHGQHLLRWAGRLWAFWQQPKYRRRRRTVFAAALIFAAAGAIQFHTDDDVRRMQSLSPALLAEQTQIQQLIGTTAGTQFFLVQAPDDETALQRQEALIGRLHPLVNEDALAGFQAPAQYVPSAARQRENRALQQAQLGGDVLAKHLEQLGLPQRPDYAGKGPILELDKVVAAESPFAFLSSFRLKGAPGETTHVVPLEGVNDLASVAAAADGLPGIRFVDPASDFSELLGKYRSRAVLLIVLSLLLMTPLLLWRYGMRRGLWALLPSTLAVILTPALRALSGDGFTFFDSMALVLVLSIGVDYAAFVAETTHDRREVTLLAVGLAALTTLLSFGLLAWSEVRAVHAFGATMLVGVTLTFLLVPLAAAANRNR